MSAISIMLSDGESSHLTQDRKIFTTTTTVTIVDIRVQNLDTMMTQLLGEQNNNHWHVEANLRRVPYNPRGNQTDVWVPWVPSPEDG